VGSDTRGSGSGGVGRGGKFLLISSALLHFPNGPQQAKINFFLAFFLSLSLSFLFLSLFLSFFTSFSLSFSLCRFL